MPAEAAVSARRYFARAFGRLERAGFDGERRHFDCIAPLERRNLDAFRRSVVELDRGLERDPAHAEAFAVKGRALLALGEYENAEAALEESLRLEPSRPRVWVWRAQCRILSGRPQEALKDAQEALRLDPACVWGHFYLAVGRLALGETRPALEAIERALSLAPSFTTLRVFQGLVKARAGDRSGGLECILQAARASGEGWPFAFSAMVRAEAGDLQAAIQDLDCAIRDAGLPWMRAQRADLRQSLGYMREAVADLDAALRLEPASPDLLARRSFLHFRMRKHAAALRDIGEAIRIQPAHPEWHRRRADIHLLLGRLPDALADIERATRAAPGAPALLPQLAMLLILNGRHQAARAVLARLDASEDGAEGARSETTFLRGYGDLRQGRFASAVRRFGACAARSGPETPAGLRAGFYGTLARSLGAGLGAEERQGAAGAEARLWLCGLGLFPPYTASLEVLQALRRADVVFNNVAGPEVTELLWALNGDCRPATYDAIEDEREWTDRMFVELRRGRRVAFVTRGHAQVFGGLAHMLIDRARRTGIPWKGFGAVSSLDVLSAGAGALLGMHVDAVQALDLPEFEREGSWSADVTLLIYFYFGVTRPAFSRLCARLARVYPPDHAVLLCGPKYDDVPVRLALGSLPAEFARMHASVILVVPPL